MTTPSELLSRAADLVRDTAAAATPGPWKVDHIANAPIVVSGDRMVCGSNPDTAGWIALASPALAPHWEALFRALVAAARQAEAIPRESARVYPKGFHAAVELARVVLGEKEDTDG